MVKPDPRTPHGQSSRGAAEVEERFPTAIATMSLLHFKHTSMFPLRRTNQHFSLYLFGVQCFGVFVFHEFGVQCVVVVVHKYGVRCLFFITCGALDLGVRCLMFLFRMWRPIFCVLATPTPVHVFSVSCSRLRHEKESYRDLLHQLPEHISYT